MRTSPLVARTWDFRPTRQKAVLKSPSIGFHWLLCVVKKCSAFLAVKNKGLAIAGALAMGCRTLLLDEPTSDLDETSRVELLAALADLHHAGYTLVMTEHRFASLERLVDRVVTMEGGKIVSDGPFPTQEPIARRTSIAAKTNDAAIAVLNEVSFGYPERPSVVNNLTISLQPGEIVALVGPNGSGKTTLLKLLCGVLQASSGHVMIAGKKSPRLSSLVGNVGFLFQNPDEQLFADTVADEIAFGPRNLNRSIDADGYLIRLGLAQYRNEHPRCLSRGERQRLAAATVLAIKPKLILLDEPTTGLDQKHWVALMEWVAEEAADARTCVVFSTHHTEAVDAFANRVLTLSEGRIVDDRLL